MNRILKITDEGNNKEKRGLMEFKRVIFFIFYSFVKDSNKIILEMEK